MIDENPGDSPTSGPGSKRPDDQVSELAMPTSYGGNATNWDNRIKPDAKRGSHEAAPHAELTPPYFLDNMRQLPRALEFANCLSEAIMSSRNMLPAVLAVLLTGFGAVLPLQAAEERFCQEYARSAVNQFRDAERHPRCDRFRQHDPARWHGNYRTHYDWCRGVPPRDANFERNERRKDLDRCTR